MQGVDVMLNGRQPLHRQAGQAPSSDLRGHPHQMQHLSQVLPPQEGPP